MKKKLTLNAVLFFVLLIMISGVDVFAAVAGDILTAPETGWQRYDDRNSDILYIGSGWTQPNTAASGNHTETICRVNGNSIKFSFIGSKIRYLYARNYNATDKVDITIDGSFVGSFSERYSSQQYQVLLFEKTDLEFKQHYVEITNNGSVSNDYFGLDSIDIDDTGSLLPYYKVQNLNAIPGDSKVTLSWNPIADATGYVIKYGTSSGNYTTTLTSVSSSAYSGYDVVGLANGTTYYFIVSAVVNGVEEDFSSEVSATPQVPFTINLVASAGDNKVSLTWDAVEGAASYNVERSTIAGGPYETIASGIGVTSYIDSSVINDTTYYYIVTASNTTGIIINSNEASAIPVATQGGNRAILDIRMSDGTEKEYDLSETELNGFLNWYDRRSVGEGKAYYIMNKTYNVKPFLSREEYIPFDKILSFEVKTYNE